MLVYIGIFSASFALTCAGIATWLHLPKGRTDTFQVRTMLNITKPLHNGSTGGKIVYWLAPIALLLFVSWLAGVVALVACLIGTMAFLPRYKAAAVLASPQS